MSRPNPLPTRLHHLSPARVRWMALGLFIATSVILFLNQDAGFTRDESFYFTYSENYQEWFADIEDAKTPEERAAAFSREPTMRIWSGNFEHPPLAKELFGFSWRTFARKDRRAIAFRVEPTPPRATKPTPAKRRGPPASTPTDPRSPQLDNADKAPPTSPPSPAPPAPVAPTPAVAPTPTNPRSPQLDNAAQTPAPTLAQAPAPAPTLVKPPAPAPAPPRSPQLDNAANTLAPPTPTPTPTPTDPRSPQLDNAGNTPPTPTPERLRFDVMATRATGFPEGAEVLLLAPLAQGQDLMDPARELARGRVTKRHRDRVEVEITPETSQLSPDRLTELAELCSRPLPTEPAQMAITPCMGREVRTLDIMSESEAFRLTGILAGGLAVMLTFLLGELMFGWLVALLGSLLFIFVPEHFFHGFMACFDMPIVALQMLTIYAFWRSLEDRRWALVTGLAWGLALLTKHNAFFVPFSLVVFWLWAGKDELALRWVGFREGLFRIQLPRFPLAFLIMPILGLTMLFAWWPRLWYDPLQSLRDWFGFHIHHEHYMQYWFGEPLQVPPFPISYPFEKTLLTYPEVLLVLLPIGVLFLVPPSTIRASLGAFWSRIRRRPRPPTTPMTPASRVAVFLLVNGLVPILVIALPSTPIFGGIKHWMTGTPFLALVAAYGFFRLTAAVSLPTWAAAALAGLVIAHPIKSSIDNAWLGTNHYNTLFAGGLQGAADNKLMRIFWGHEARYALDWLNANAPLHAKVYWQDATWGTFEMYQREGWLRHDIRYLSDFAGADIALNETLQALWEPDQRARRSLGVAGPLFVLARHGVPYLNVYVRRSLELAPP